MKILLSGAGGHMGREVISLAGAGVRNAEIICGVDPFPLTEAGFPCFGTFDDADPGIRPDCIIDFSVHTSTGELTAYALRRGIPLVIATTGQTKEEKEMIKKASESIPVFFAANYSLGIALLIELAKKAARAMPDAEIEIIEKHHDRKLDAPSGTALAIAEAIREVRPGSEINTGRSGNGKRTKEEIGIHAVRMGNIVGEHEVLIGTQNQTITLKHEAHSRALFAEGALAAAEYICGKEPGMYSMKDLVK